MPTLSSFSPTTQTESKRASPYIRIDYKDKTKVVTSQAFRRHAPVQDHGGRGSVLGEGPRQLQVNHEEELEPAGLGHEGGDGISSKAEKHSICARVREVDP